MKRTTADTIKVELQRFGESTQFVELEVGATIEDLCDKVGLDYGTEIRYNGDVVNLDDELEDGDVLVLPTKKITQG